VIPFLLLPGGPLSPRLNVRGRGQAIAYVVIYALFACAMAYITRPFDWQSPWMWCFPAFFLICAVALVIVGIGMIKKQ
jgi:hypothetical protein